jgi:hypothetical protein
MYYPGICLKGLRKAMKNLRVVSVLAKIQTEHLPDVDDCDMTDVA